MPNQENLVEIMGKLGQPPEGVDIETYAIAKVDPTVLHTATRAVTPSYEETLRIKEKNPALYKFLTEEPQPEKSLGEGILLKQQRLSRFRRTAATVLATVTLGTGVGALTYSAKESYRVDKPSIAQEDPNRGEQRATSALAGGFAGVTGGLAVYLGGFFLTHRLARRPAERIVHRAEQTSA